MQRVLNHPVLPVPADRREVDFSFDGRAMKGYEGEMISSALFANGVTAFSRHQKGGAPQGIFCANGQCSQCTVLVDGIPMKACVTPLAAGQSVRTLAGVPELPAAAGAARFGPVRRIEADVLVIGGGPAGLGAARELSLLGLSVIVADDKERLGGKLLLQTHKFFGSEEDCYAGTRGVDIARKLEAELRSSANVTILTNSPVVGLYEDKVAGIYENRTSYLLAGFGGLVVAAGARERSILFPGNDLPGVYGAGAFQTLVNRDLVSAAKRVLIVGSGNVGLIAAYHALQAGIEVAGIFEILDSVNGYKVHADKIRRMGVPVHLAETVVAAEGDGRVERAVVAPVDRDRRPIMERARAYAVDTILIAAGLTPCDEYLDRARAFGFPAVAAGDAEEIAEASSALFGGRIAARTLARRLGAEAALDPAWEAKREVLKSRPGERITRERAAPSAEWSPVFFCDEEIPCNPCATVCPSGSIRLESRRGNIMDLPYFWKRDCRGCAACVAACPGLAVSLARAIDPAWSEVVLPYEFLPDFGPGDRRALLGQEGEFLEEAELLSLSRNRKYGTWLLRFKVSSANAARAIGVRVQAEAATAPLPGPVASCSGEDAVVCRCERVTLGELVAFIKENEVRDVNQLKTLRAGMGACGSKTCSALYASAFRLAGVDPRAVAPGTIRPLAVEMPLGAAAGTEATP